MLFANVYRENDNNNENSSQNFSHDNFNRNFFENFENFEMNNYCQIKRSQFMNFDFIF